MSKNETLDSPLTIRRWRPDFRYCDNKFIDVPLKNFESTEPSVTDKEAYRLTLASLRGELAQGTGKIDVGSYSLKPGEEYNPEFDFSFLHRKDLTIVELDEYIKKYEQYVKDNDIAITSEIESQLAMAQKKREQLSKDSTDKNNDVKS